MEKAEIIEVPFHFQGGEYLFTCGELSRFFKEVIDNKKIYGTKCPHCDKVWMPPRGHCPDCYAENTWVPLSGKGTVVACTYCYFPGMSGDLMKYLDIPYVQALVLLDGADSCLYHTVAVKEQKLGVIKEGTRVKAVFRDERKGTIADFYFVPDEDS